MKRPRECTTSITANQYAEMPLGDRRNTVDNVKRAMTDAARQAVAENDRLGVPTPGGLNGNVVWRQLPTKARNQAP